MTSGRDLDSQATKLQAKLDKIKDRQAARDLRKNDEEYRAFNRALSAMKNALSFIGTDEADWDDLSRAISSIEDRMGKMRNAKPDATPLLDEMERAP